MDKTILIAVLSSSILTAAFSKIIDFVFKNFDFKKDYHKKIIDKRLKAYDLLDELIQLMVGDIKSKTSKDKLYNQIFYDESTYMQFAHALQKATTQRIWYSTKTGQLITEFQTLISRSYIESEIEVKSKSYIYNQWGILLFTEVNIFQKELEKALRDDLKKIYKVDKFLKEI